MATELNISIEWSNMLIWLWLETLALGMMILWTLDLARVLVARRFQNCSKVKIIQKKKIIDRLPMNGDIVLLPFGSKAFITLVRWTITILVAVSALGIEPTTVFNQSQPSKQVVVANKNNFPGRSVNLNDRDALPDFAASTCEEIDVMSVKKLKTFISDSRFSCNTGKHVGNRDVIAEVIIDRDAIENISRGEKRPVNIKLGDLSKMNKVKSNNTDVLLVHSLQFPGSMSLNRTHLKNTVYGECDGDREYIVISNDKDVEPIGHMVAVALVICTPGSTVLLRNTDQLVTSSSDRKVNQRLMLARRAMTSLISITSNEKERVYYGETLKTTVISTGYNYLILILSITNVVLFVLMRVARAYYSRGLHVDIFSPISMYSLATSYCAGKTPLNSPPEKEIVLREERIQDEIEVLPVEQEPA